MKIKINGRYKVSPFLLERGKNEREKEWERRRKEKEPRIYTERKDLQDKFIGADPYKVCEIFLCLVRSPTHQHV